jgi:hypothetical protein
VRLCSIAQAVKNNSGLNSREFRAYVELKDLVHVLCEIQHDSNIAALARQACPGPSR